MIKEVAIGWRRIDLGHSPGQDFLGLAAPIENILDEETSGITNATQRARYLSLVPWYYWRYTQLAGYGNARDQRQFAIGFETLLAYANIAWVEKTGVPMSGILRRDFCEARWKESRANLPIRGDGVGTTPSPLDAVNYGPSLRRLRLLDRNGQLHSCRRKGEAIAVRLDQRLRVLPGYDEIVTASELARTTIELWADSLSLNCAAPFEVQFLREVLFGIEEDPLVAAPPRVHALLLLLRFAMLTEAPFTAADVEVALVRGRRREGVVLEVDLPLVPAYQRWRILAVLKFLRHASELAFLAVHIHVQQADRAFVSAQEAAQDVIEQTLRALLATGASETLGQMVDASEMTLPTWTPADSRPATILSHGLHLAAWCQALLRSPAGRQLLQLDMARVGQSAAADLRSYSVSLDSLVQQPLTAVLRWLCVDRGVARHFQVASRKLAQHDTFRLIEDEAGVRATQKCAVADVAIRLDAMLSLLTDVRLLDYDANGYRRSADTQSWYDSQLARIAGGAGVAAAD